MNKIASIVAAIIAIGLAAGAQHAARVHRHPARRRPGPEEVSLARLGDDITAPGGMPFEGLWRLTDMPDWLHAIARPEHLRPAMERSIAEFASGAMALQHVRPRRSRLENGVFEGMFELSVQGPGGARRVVCLRGAADPRRPAPVDDISPGVRFGEDGWRCAVPEIRLVLETAPADHRGHHRRAAWVPPRAEGADPGSRPRDAEAQRSPGMRAAGRHGQGHRGPSRPARQDRARVGRPPWVRRARTDLWLEAGDGR